MFIVSESDGLDTVFAGLICRRLCVIAAFGIFLYVVVQAVPDVHANGVRFLEDFLSNFLIVDVTIPALSGAVHKGLVLVPFPHRRMVREARGVEPASFLATNI